MDHTHARVECSADDWWGNMARGAPAGRGRRVDGGEGGGDAAGDGDAAGGGDVECTHVVVGCIHVVNYASHTYHVLLTHTMSHSHTPCPMH